jgi:hypothetical protein
MEKETSAFLQEISQSIRTEVGTLEEIWASIGLEVKMCSDLLLPFPPA